MTPWKGWGKSAVANAHMHHLFELMDVGGFFFFGFTSLKLHSWCDHPPSMATPPTIFWGAGFQLLPPPLSAHTCDLGGLESMAVRLARRGDTRWELHQFLRRVRVRGGYWRCLNNMAQGESLYQNDERVCACVACQTKQQQRLATNYPKKLRAQC